MIYLLLTFNAINITFEFVLDVDHVNTFTLEPLLERRQRAMDMAAAYRRWLVPALLDSRPPLGPPAPPATAAAWLGQLRDYYRSDAARAPADMIREDLDRVDSSLADTMAAVGAVAQVPA